MRIPLLAFVVLLIAAFASNAPAQEKGKKAKLPNIVWITSEDHGPHMGCYGDALARTPRLDKFAKKSMMFRLAWSNAPVCAPARTTIITGVYPTSSGSQHMRSQTRLPADMRMFTYYLRMLGYYCTNKVKEDYNLEKGKGVWDDSSNKAHWRNRKPGQPFFAVFNSTKSHESQIRNYKKKPKTDPAKVRLPAYHPELPEARIDWAHYYDSLEKVDADAAQILQELADAGLLEDTIIIYFADHGSGMPRNKRTPLNCGLHVPMIVHFPDNWRHLAPKEYRPDSVSERLVSFVDLAPTMLSLAGAEPKSWMQGQAFAGKYAKEGPKYMHGFRGRMDERYDLQRSVTDGRYVYLRNYMPHLPAGQHVEYMFQTRTTKGWKDRFDAGKLNEAQSLFWKSPRPAEELYDLKSDPDEVNNIAGAESALIQGKLRELREAHKQHIFAIRDVGFLPEDEIHSRSKGSTPYEMGHDPKKYPLDAIWATASGATDISSDIDLGKALKHEDSAARYWAALGIQLRGKEAVTSHRKGLLKALHDSSPSVQVVAAEVLATHGGKDIDDQSVKLLVDRAHPRKNSAYVSLAALNALDRLGDKVRPYRETVEGWPTAIPPGYERSAYGVPRLIAKIKEQWK